MPQSIPGIYNDAAAQVAQSGQGLQDFFGQQYAGIQGNLAQSAGAMQAPTGAMQELNVIPQSMAARAQLAAQEQAAALQRTLQAQAPIHGGMAQNLQTSDRNAMNTRVKGEDQIANMRKQAAMSEAQSNHNIAVMSAKRAHAQSGGGGGGGGGPLGGLTPKQYFDNMQNIAKARADMRLEYQTNFDSDGKRYIPKWNPNTKQMERIPVSGKQQMDYIRNQFAPGMAAMLGITEAQARKVITEDLNQVYRQNKLGVPVTASPQAQGRSGMGVINRTTATAGAGGAAGGLATVMAQKIPALGKHIAKIPHPAAKAAGAAAMLTGASSFINQARNGEIPWDQAALETGRSIIASLGEGVDSGSPWQRVMGGLGNTQR